MQKINVICGASGLALTEKQQSQSLMNRVMNENVYQIESKPECEQTW